LIQPEFQHGISRKRQLSHENFLPVSGDTRDAADNDADGCLIPKLETVFQAFPFFDNADAHAFHTVCVRKILRRIPSHTPPFAKKVSEKLINIITCF